MDPPSCAAAVPVHTAIIVTPLPSCLTGVLFCWLGHCSAGAFPRWFQGGLVLRRWHHSVWFGFITSALLLSVVLCWVDCGFDSWVLLGLLCFLRVTAHSFWQFSSACVVDSWVLPPLAALRVTPSHLQSQVPTDHKRGSDLLGSSRTHMI